jgi:hypothetical protein
MTHMRYWALTFAVAIGGAFIAIERFAFAPANAVWIAFGVAAAAVVFALAATLVALLRDNQGFSGLSAISALVAVWTVIATRTFTTPTALWLAFGGGVALLALSLRALALHETTVERVVHQLDVNGFGEPRAIRRRGIEISGTMRSWLHWLGFTGLGLAGAFVVASTFIWPHATAQVSPRWLAFAVAVAAAAIGLALLLDGLVDLARANLTTARAIEIALTATAVAVAGVLIVLTAAHGVDNLRWWMFGLGATLAGDALLASTVHELSSERVRHELEVARSTAGDLVAAAG